MIRIIQTYLVFGFPFVIACMILSTIWPQGGDLSHTGVFGEIIWNILGYNIITWFAVLVLFLLILVAVPHVREKTLRRLANLQERDEREEYITGKASRAAYVSTLSLMILFLFFSIFSFNVHKIPPEQSIDNKHYSFNISIGFSLRDKNQSVTPSKEGAIFQSKDYSLSSTAFMVILFSWHLVAFNLAARREKNKGLY